MRVLVLVPLMLLVIFPAGAQTDSLEIRKAPVLSNLPIIFDRGEISQELNAIEQPVFTALPVEVSQVDVTSRAGDQRALQLRIPEVSLDDIDRSWARFIRKEGDGKLERDGNRLFMEDLQIDEVSSKYFNAEFWMDQDSNHAVITMAMMTDSTTINPDTDRDLFNAMEDLLAKRGRETYREKVENDLDEERKKLNDMEKQLNNLVKDSEKSHKRISDNNIAINQANMDIDRNAGELKATGEELGRNRSAVSSARDKESKKEAKKQENQTEKAQKKLQKEREKLFQGIIDAKREIEESEQDIRKNLEDQRQLLLDMHRQTLVIEAMKTKLESI